jgi:hypothetical protein
MALIEEWLQQIYFPLGFSFSFLTPNPKFSPHPIRDIFSPIPLFRKIYHTEEEQEECCCR